MRADPKNLKFWRSFNYDKFWSQLQTFVLSLKGSTGSYIVFATSNIVIKLLKLSWTKTKLGLLVELLTRFIIFTQLDSADEQAAAIRRELDGRMQKVTEMERVWITIYNKLATLPLSFSTPSPVVFILNPHPVSIFHSRGN